MKSKIAEGGALKFFADPDQLATLVVSADYDRPDNLSVIIPYI